MQVHRTPQTSRPAFLAEEMTFDQLFRYSEPKRVKRSQQVRGPPLEIDSHSDSVYHHFNFKSYPSTTGLRWHGYVKFNKPKHGKDRRPLQHIPCEVDCSCPDFKYRFAWADKQRGASRIGPQSLNKCINRAPRITNPANVPGLCKHILSTRDYIYGMLSQFPKGEPDTGEKLAQVVKWADKRWADFHGDMRKARDQEKWFAAVKRAVNAGRAGDVEFINQIYRGMGGTGIGIPRGIRPDAAPAAPTGGPPPGPEEPPPLPPKEPKKPKKTGPVLPAAGKPSAAGEKPSNNLAVPPGERGRTMPPAQPGGTMAKITPPGKRGRRMPPFKESLTAFLRALVNRVNGSIAGANDMRKNELNEAIRLVEEIQADEVPAPSEIAHDMGGHGEEAPMHEPPPSEPPVDDAAVGADSEANLVIQLLADIRHFLGILAGEEGEGGVEGEEEMPGGPGEMGELPPGEEGEGGVEGEEDGSPIDAIPEAPEDEDEPEEDEEDLATAGKHHAPEEEE